MAKPGPKSPEPDDATDISSVAVEKFGENDPSEITPDNDCDGYSCTGLEYEMTVGNQAVSYGQCQLDGICFVKESSSCPKFASKLFPGKFISTVACDHPNAPKPRFFGLIAAGISGLIAGIAAG